VTRNNDDAKERSVCPAFVHPLSVLHVLKHHNPGQGTLTLTHRRLPGRRPWLDGPPGERTGHQPPAADERLDSARDAFGILTKSFALVLCEARWPGSSAAPHARDRAAANRRFTERLDVRRWREEVMRSALRVDLTAYLS